MTQKEKISSLAITICSYKQTNSTISKIIKFLKQILLNFKFCNSTNEPNKQFLFLRTLLNKLIKNKLFLYQYNFLMLFQFVKHFQPFDDQWNDNQLERLLGCHEKLTGPHRPKPFDHQPGHQRPHRLLCLNAVHHAQAHKPHFLELWRWTVQTYKVRF